MFMVAPGGFGTVDDTPFNDDPTYRETIETHKAIFRHDFWIFS